MRLRLSRLALRERLFLMIVGPLVVVAVLASLARYIQFAKLSRQVYDNTLYSIALTISRDVMFSQGDMLTDQLLQAMTQALGDEIYYRVTGPEGAYVTGYSNAPARGDVGPLETNTPMFYDSVVAGQPVRALIMEDYVMDVGPAGVATVEVWQTVNQRNALSRNLIFQTILYFAALVSTAALFVWFGITFGLRPLRELENAILARTPDDLKPIRRWVPPELATLVQAMNALFGRLTTAFALRDAFISDAAHQVRNPIAAIQAQAEAAMTSPNEEVLRARGGSRRRCPPHGASDEPIAVDGAGTRTAFAQHRAARRSCTGDRKHHPRVRGARLVAGRFHYV
ncbi:sensor histidine kinase N-terminal domain-containing protein [Albirhodobacter sp. R86504]|uniref:sensor histidine kinase N-terminal domain-containing protein n=1 Tax=Albirhodobacter sp. R86504 TaxID=3093848 RepID=UPI00366BCCA5